MNPNPSDHTVPTYYPDSDPERTLLGYCLMMGNVPEEIQGQLCAEDFSEGYRFVARSVLDAAKRTGFCDVVTVSEEMIKRGAGIFTVRELGVLAEAAPVGPVNLDHLLRVLRERNGRPPQERFTRPLSSLLSVPDEPIPYLIERLLVAAANGFIGGEPKSLKSWVALHIALCLSLGVRVFGRYPVPQPMRVLFISEEDGERRIKGRIRKLLMGLGVNPPGDDFFRYSIKAGIMLDEPEWIERLRAEMAEYKPGIVIGDVFELMHSKDGDKRSEMKPVFRNLDQLREEFSCGFLLADHFKKASVGTSKRGGQRLSGTVGKHAFGECSLYLFPAQGTNRVRVETELKDGPSETFGLVLEDTEDGGMVFTWQAEAEDQTATMKAKVLAAIEELAPNQSWVTAKQVTVLIGVSPNTAKKYLDLLVDEDQKLERDRLQLGKTKPWHWRLRA